MRDETEYYLAQEELRKASEQLQREHQELIARNETLRETLDHLQEDKSRYRHELSSRIDNLLRLAIARFRANLGQLNAEDASILEQRLGMITSHEGEGFEDNLSKLSPRESEVCRLIQQGSSSREIAQSLGLSPETVNKHRQSIRRKLQIDHREINLSSYLRSK
jgi:DNA-binding CsgD family transcriptional regulator